MRKAVTIEINEIEAGRLERLIDETLIALQSLEEQSQARDARFEQKQARTSKLMDEIENRMAEIDSLNASRRAFTTILSAE